MVAASTLEERNRGANHKLDAQWQLLSRGGNRGENVSKYLLLALRYMCRNQVDGRKHKWTEADGSVSVWMLSHRQEVKVTTLEQAGPWVRGRPRQGLSVDASVPCSGALAGARIRVTGAEPTMPRPTCVLTVGAFPELDLTWVGVPRSTVGLECGVRRVDGGASGERPTEK